jgi:hypothetical protein
MAGRSGEQFDSHIQKAAEALKNKIIMLPAIGLKGS